MKTSIAQLFLIVCVIVVGYVQAVPTQLQWQMGKEYIYTLKGVVDTRGNVVGSNERTSGTFSTMDSILVIEPTQQTSDHYIFVMNMFNTQVNVGQSVSTKIIGDSLGYDMYFQQQKTGEIVKIWYNTQDPIYYVNVKVGAINSFQTTVVGVGESKTVLESDPIGNHTARVQGQAGNPAALVLTKNFNQVDFTAFPDKSLSTKNMAISAQTVIGVHDQGHIMSTSMSQLVVLTDANAYRSSAKSSSKSGKSVEGLTNSTGFDMNMSSLGTLSLSLSGIKSSQTFKNSEPGDSYVSDTLYGFATKASYQVKVDANTLHNFLETFKTAVHASTNDAATVALLMKLGNHLRYNLKDLQMITPYLESLETSSVEVVRRIFFIFSSAQQENLLIKYGLQSLNIEVQKSAILYSAYLEDPSVNLIRMLSSIAKNTASDDVRSFAELIRTSCIEKAASKRVEFQMPTADAELSSDFPFNRSFAKGFKLGGKVANVEFDSELFAGTNFNCNNNNFNYETLAQAKATATLFGVSEQAFFASAIYGKANGSPLADAMQLTVWGKQIYNKAFPQVDCSTHAYPLAHAAPGFSVQYTLWVSVIPVLFSASAALDLKLSWDWSICDSQLSALVELVPAGTLVLAGNAHVDLLYLRAGLELSGSFNMQVIPQAFVRGSLCEAGFDVVKRTQPMAAKFDSYYQWQHCKYLFFDCHWETRNQHDWWSWSAPAVDQTIFQQVWKISP